MSLIVQTVQWHHGSGSGARSARLYNVSKIHMTVSGVRTLCGRMIPRPKNLLPPSMHDGGYCQHCVNVKTRRESG